MRLLLCLSLSATLLWASDCGRTFTGLYPLTAPFPPDYQGVRLGLYPGGSNARPLEFEARGRAQAGHVRPRDATGAIDDANGRIVLISVGMSNTTQEFSAFQQLAARDGTLNPRLTLVDGAQGGWTAARIVSNPETYFATIDQRLASARAVNAQVQAAWIKLADAQPTAPFPDHARLLLDKTKMVLGLLRARYPNLRLVYLSSRIYAGYASTGLNPEPWAYESGFAVKWLIEEQIAGDPDVPAVPWISWGPYLWADGTRIRGDGLTWACSDLANDGTHPAAAGRLKVAQMLMDFFKNDPTARPWFVAGTSPPARAPVIASIVNGASYRTEISPGSIASILGTGLASGEAYASGFPLPYGLAGSRVTAGGEPALIYAVSPGQINIVVPPDARSAVVTVSREGVDAQPVTVQLTSDTIGLFSLDWSGSGAVAARHADGRLIDSSAPARRGETVELYGTGKGIRHRTLAELPAVVRVGGVLADATYYGSSAGTPGLDQINITIPAGAPMGDSVPVQVQVGSFVSNTVTLAISP